MKKIFALLFVSGLLVGLAQAQPSVTVFEFIRLNEGFSTLTRVLEETGLAETLQQEGAVTLFAPTDAAFAALPDSQRNALLGNPQALKALLNGLIVPEKLAVGDLLERGQLKTVAGANLSFSRSADDMVVLDGDAAVVATDVGLNGGIRISNGIVQVIDTLPSALR